jgi:hypothetical protein
MVGISLRHKRFLRAVVLVSAAHPEVRRRGSRYSQELGEGFAHVVRAAQDAIAHRDPGAAIRSCFAAVFSTSIIRVAYGPGFATPEPVDDAAFIADLAEIAVRYMMTEGAETRASHRRSRRP